MKQNLREVSIRHLTSSRKTLLKIFAKVPFPAPLLFALLPILRLSRPLRENLLLCSFQLAIKAAFLLERGSGLQGHEP